MSLLGYAPRPGALMLFGRPVQSSPSSVWAYTGSTERLWHTIRTITPFAVFVSGHRKGSSYLPVFAAECARAAHPSFGWVDCFAAHHGFDRFAARFGRFPSMRAELVPSTRAVSQLFFFFSRARTGARSFVFYFFFSRVQANP